MQHKRAWLSLAILFALVVLSYVDRSTIILLVEPLKRDLGISDLQISFLQGLAFALCYALAGPPLAWIADRYSRHKVIFGGVTIWSAATMGSGLTSDYHHLLAARFFVGVGEAALLPAAYSLVADLFTRRRHALAFGILSAGVSVGGSLALAGGGALLDWADSVGGVTLPFIGAVRPWQLVFLVAGAPGIFVAALIFLIPDMQSRSVAETADKAALGISDWLRCHWDFVMMFTGFVTFLCAAAYAVTYWTPSFFIRVYGATLSDFSGALAMIQLAGGLIGFIGGGYVVDRLGRRGFRNAPYVHLTGAVILLLIASVGAFWLRAGIVPSLAFLALFSIAAPYLGVVATELHMATPRWLRSQMVAIVTAVYTLVGMIIGPSSVAFFTDGVFVGPLQLGHALTIVAVIYCPAALLLLLLSRRGADRAIRHAAAISG